MTNPDNKVDTDNNNNNNNNMMMINDHNDDDDTNSDDDDDMSSSIRSCDDNEVRDLEGNRMNTNNDNDDKDNPIIVSSQRTKKDVRKVKALSIVVLVISIAGAIGVFFYTKNLAN